MVITTALAAIIAERVKAHTGSSDETAHGAIKAALEMGALPLLPDMGGIFALKPDGEIVSIPWDEPQALQVETDPRVRNIVLFQGSKKYPELAELIPPMPTNASLCPYCKGTGTAPVPSGVSSEHFVCYCGGLGWIP